MNAEMVRATLDDRKTQTRRVMNYPESYIWNHDNFKDNYVFSKMFLDDRTGNNVAIFKHINENFTEWFKCPYGVVGDRLWVREKWRIYHGTNWAQLYYSDESELPVLLPYDSCESLSSLHGKWRPSIHMPRWASRVTLEITDVRVERVRDITELAAIEEGIPRVDPNTTHAYHHRGQFQVLWDSINEKRGFGWESNPWVWVISFKRIAP